MLHGAKESRAVVHAVVGLSQGRLNFRMLINDV